MSFQNVMGEGGAMGGCNVMNGRVFGRGSPIAVGI